jgi:hypothetical protein
VIPTLSSAAELAAERAIRDYVLSELPLAVYDPLVFRRPRVPVADFVIELLEFDLEDRVAHASGPVTLRTDAGEVQTHLRVSIPVALDGGECRLEPERGCRAAYIVDLGSETGACKETAALASV